MMAYNCIYIAEDFDETSVRFAMFCGSRWEYFNLELTGP